MPARNNLCRTSPSPAGEREEPNKGQSRIYGIHAVTSLFEKSPERIVCLYVQEPKSRHTAELIERAKLLKVSVHLLSVQMFNQLMGPVNHQGLAVDCFKPHYFTENDLKRWVDNPDIQPFFLVLDGVQDPHNLGACLRSADAAGVHAVIVPKDRSVGLTPTVAKVACGAAETVPLITVTNLSRTLNFLKEHQIWCVGLDGDANTSVYQFNLTGKLALVLGGEGKGLRRLTRETCDELLSIPMQGSVPSLNVSVATGIVLFETLRQKKRVMENSITRQSTSRTTNL
jgi:23S rRNA (guanosine2251-2'-O)-methyltransferase